MDPDDRQLLTAAAHGDHAALEALVQRHAPLVLTACRRQLPAADADDAAQAVFLLLWRRTAAAAAAPGLPGWLVVTARQVCANARRAAHRRQHAEHAMPPPATPEAPPNEARALLDEALASLPTSEREAVIRRHLLGEDPLTVAAALACAEGTVHSRTSRGLERLRTWFARHGIATTATGLLALCADECAAARLADPPASLLGHPSSHAVHVAGASAPPFLATLGIPLMTITAFSLSAVIALAQLAAVGPAAETPAPLTPYNRVYDISDLYDPSVLLTPQDPVHGVQHPAGPQEPPPAADPGAVQRLDACHRLDEFTTTLQIIAGGRALVRMIDAGMNDADLVYGQPGQRPHTAAEVRASVGGMASHVMPRTALPRGLQVVADQTVQARVSVHLAAVRDLRRARISARVAAAGTTLLATAHALYGANWGSRETPVPHPPLITTLPQATIPPQATVPPQAALPPQATLPPVETGHPFVVIWLPEDGPFGSPLAVATDGACSLLLVPGIGVLWQPGILPARIALRLRQQIDRHLFRSPLSEKDWQLVCGWAAFAGLADADSGKPSDLTDLLDQAQHAPAPNF